MSGDEWTYPSGAPMPPYGIPTTDDERITDGLEWAYDMLVRRDQMNAAVHCGPVRWSDVTTKVQIALGAHRERLSKARPLLADMDRCEHGRHAKDHCFDCGHPPRKGNPHLDDVIGYRVRGGPITLRELLASVAAGVSGDTEDGGENLRRGVSGD